MSQRFALLISTALTVAILLTGVGLAVRVLRADAAAEAPAAAVDDADAAEQDRQLGEAVTRLQASNAALATSYDRIDRLTAAVEQLRAENAVLRQREGQYQERIAEANARLRREGVATIALPPADKPPTGSAATGDARTRASGSREPERRRDGRIDDRGERGERGERDRG